MIERAVGAEPAKPLRWRLPAGEGRSQVRSLRPHAHPLLVVVGVVWVLLDARADSWISREIGRRKARAYTRGRDQHHPAVARVPSQRAG